MVFESLQAMFGKSSDGNPASKKRKVPEEEDEAACFAKAGRIITNSINQFQRYADLCEKAAMEAKAASKYSDQVTLLLRLHEPAPVGTVALAWQAEALPMTVPDSFTVGDVMALVSHEGRGTFAPKAMYRRPLTKDELGPETSAARSSGQEVRFVLRDIDTLNNVLDLSEDGTLGSEDNPLELWVQVQPHGMGKIRSACGYHLKTTNTGIRTSGVRHRGGPRAGAGTLSLTPFLKGSADMTAALISNAAASLGLPLSLPTSPIANGSASAPAKPTASAVFTTSPLAVANAPTRRSLRMTDKQCSQPASEKGEGGSSEATQDDAEEQDAEAQAEPDEGTDDNPLISPLLAAEIKELMATVTVPPVAEVATKSRSARKQNESKPQTSRKTAAANENSDGEVPVGANGRPRRKNAGQHSRRSDYIQEVHVPAVQQPTSELQLAVNKGGRDHDDPETQQAAQALMSVRDLFDQPATNRPTQAAPAAEPARAIIATAASLSGDRPPARQPGERRARMKYSDQEIHAILDGLLALTEAQRETAWATIKRGAGDILAQRSNVDLKDKWRNLQLQWYKNELTPEVAAKVLRVKAKTEYVGPWPEDMQW